MRTRIWVVLLCLIHVSWAKRDDPRLFDTEGSGDYDDNYYDDDYYDDDELSGDYKELEEDEYDDIDTPSSTTESDIHFLEDDEDRVKVVSDEDVVLKKNVDGLLYEYNNEDDEEDYDVDPPSPPHSDPPRFVVDTNLIVAVSVSAGITFLVAVVGFFVVKRCYWTPSATKNGVMPFVIDSKDPRRYLDSSPIVKNYQRVPTTTRDFLFEKDAKLKPLL